MPCCLPGHVSAVTLRTGWGVDPDLERNEVFARSVGWLCKVGPGWPRRSPGTCGEVSPWSPRRPCLTSFCTKAGLGRPPEAPSKLLPLAAGNTRPRGRCGGWRTEKVLRKYGNGKAACSPQQAPDGAGLPGRWRVAQKLFLATLWKYLIFSISA